MPDLTRDLRQGDLTVAFCAVIKKLGDLLAEPLPREAGDENELSDALVTLE